MVEMVRKKKVKKEGKKEGQKEERRVVEEIAFPDFKKRIVNTLKRAGFSDVEIKQLEMMMDSNYKRGLVFIQALLTVFKLTGISKSDLEELKELFNVAYINMQQGNSRVFTKEQSERLVEILGKYTSYKTAHRLRKGIEDKDRFLVSSLAHVEEMEEKRKIKKIKPKKA